MSSPRTQHDYNKEIDDEAQFYPQRESLSNYVHLKQSACRAQMHDISHKTRQRPSGRKDLLRSPPRDEPCVPGYQSTGKQRLSSMVKRQTQTFEY